MATIMEMAMATTTAMATITTMVIAL
jgi:hypothetical protein